MDSMSILFQFALNPERRVEYEFSTSVKPSLKFIDAVCGIFAEYPRLLSPGKFSPERIEVYVNRSPSNPFFPIAASPQQLEAYKASLKNPPHALVPAADLNLTVAEVIAKHKIAVFTLYLKSTP